MEEKWVELGRSSLAGDHRIRVERDTSGEVYHVLEIKRKFERDITTECKVELTKSQHSSGYYCNVIWEGKSILALGVDDLSKASLRKGFRLMKAPNAFLSFRILKDS